MSRAYKRLIYVVFVWTCVCFVLFKIGTNVQQQQQRSSFFSFDFGEANELAAGSGQAAADDQINGLRGLLQNDYSIVSTRGRDSAASSIVSPADKLTGSGESKKASTGLSAGTKSEPKSTFALLPNERAFFDLQPLVDKSKSPSESEFLSQLAQYAYNADHANVKANDSNNEVIDNSTNTSGSDSKQQPPQPANNVSSSSNGSAYTNSNHNLPLADWPRMRHLKFKMTSASGEKCNLDYPSLYDLHFNNLYWQVLRGYGPPGPKPTGTGVPSSTNSSTTAGDKGSNQSVSGSSTPSPAEANFYLYNAYYDDRERGGPLATVRLLAMIDRVQPPLVTCLLWYPQLSQPVITLATFTYVWYGKWGNYKDGVLQPYLVNCKVPRLQTSSGRLQAPSSVSLAIDRCSKLTNNLRVVDARPAGGKGDFAVCVKGLDFLHQDLSVRLVEWIELLRLLGAQKVFLYQLETHPNISKILNYYAEEDGFIQLTKLTLPGEQPNLPGFRHLFLKNRLTSKRQNELIPYNDCLYRNLHSFRYLVLLDIDEIIMPLNHGNWSNLMTEVEQASLKEHNYTRASYNVRNAYFLDDLTGLDKQSPNKQTTAYKEPGIPSYMHMLSHVYRSRNYTKPGQYVKCFHNTERVVSLHNHFPLNCFGYCTTYSMSTEQAQLQHYRKDCVGPLRNACNSDFRAHTVRDTTIWRYKEPLIKKVTDVLQKLQFFNGQQDANDRRR